MSIVFFSKDKSDDDVSFKNLREGIKYLERIELTSHNREKHIYGGNVTIGSTISCDVTKEWGARYVEEGRETYKIDDSVYCIDIWPEKGESLLSDQINSKRVKEEIAKFVVEFDEDFPKLRE